MIKHDEQSTAHHAAVIGSLLFNSSKLLMSRSSHLLALILSITAHLVLVFVFGRGYGLAAPTPATHRATVVQIFSEPAAYGGASVKLDRAILQNSEDVSLGIPSMPEAVQAKASDADAPAAESSSNLTPDALRASSDERILPDEPQAFVPLIIPATPHYFTSKELTDKPRVVQDIPANFTLRVPEDAPDSAIVRLLINEQGQIDSVLIEDSTLSESNEKTIRDAFGKLLFVPGKIGEMAVKSQLRIEILLEKLPLHPIIVSPVQQVK